MQQVSAKHWKSFFRSFIVSRCQELESLLMCLKTVNQKLSGCVMGEASHRHGAFCWLSVDRTSHWTETNAASWPWLQHSWSALSICSACLIICEEKKVSAKFSKIVIALKQYFSSRWAVRAPLDCSKSFSVQLIEETGQPEEGQGQRERLFWGCCGTLSAQEATDSGWEHGRRNGCPSARKAVFTNTFLQSVSTGRILLSHKVT